MKKAILKARLRTQVKQTLTQIQKMKANELNPEMPKTEGSQAKNEEVLIRACNRRKMRII